jgi:hypothetical protein
MGLNCFVQSQVSNQARKLKGFGADAAPMKNYYFLVVLSLLVFSCTEDVSKEISTDLTKEADQFFQFSEAQWESGYLGNISYPDYFRIASSELPGCPNLIRSTSSRIIRLDYSNPVACTQENQIPRTGIIELDFTLSNSTNPVWTMTFKEYSFGGIKINGSKQFRSVAFNENQETFENLRIELENNLEFVFNGTLSYSISRLSARPFGLSSRGRIEGRNPAGRQFSLVITEAKEQSFACYREGWVLPQIGKESWIVSRGPKSNLEYKVSFDTQADCDPFVNSTLPDGRTLQLNP